MRYIILIYKLRSVVTQYHRIGWHKFRGWYDEIWIIFIHKEINSTAVTVKFKHIVRNSMAPLRSYIQ